MFPTDNEIEQIFKQFAGSDRRVGALRRRTDQLVWRALMLSLGLNFLLGFSLVWA